MMVVNEVRRESPYGGFVKQNVSSGEWYEVVRSFSLILFYCSVSHGFFCSVYCRVIYSLAKRRPKPFAIAFPISTNPVRCREERNDKRTESRLMQQQQLLGKCAARNQVRDSESVGRMHACRLTPFFVDETLVLVDTTLSFSDPSAKSSSPSNYKNTSQDGDGERMHHSKRLQQQHRASIISISEMLLTDTSFLDDLENLDDIWDDDDEQQPSSSKPSARVSVAPLPGAHQQEASSSSRRRSSLISIANIFAVMQEEKSSSSPARVSMNMGMTTTTSRRTSVTAARRRSSLISLASIRAAVMDTSTTTTAVDYSHDDTLEDMLRALGGDEDCWQPDTAMSCTQPSQ